MPTVYIRDVPSKVVNSLRRKAAKKQNVPVKRANLNQYAIEIFIKHTAKEINRFENGKN